MGDSDRDILHTWDTVGPVCIRSWRCIRLRVALVKLTFEDAEQAGDPVVQSYIQYKLNNKNTRFSFVPDLNYIFTCIQHFEAN